MRKKICGIYSIRNLKSGKLYIGQSVNINKRFKEHKISLKLSKHDNDHLQKAWNKYKENSFVFEVIEECKEEELNDREIFYIKNHKDISYNMNDGGYGNRGYRHSEETKKKLSTLNKRIFSEETRKKISEANKGKKMSQEAIEKIKKGNIGKNLGRLKGIKRPPFSDEWKRKIGEAAKGRHAWNKGKHNIFSEDTLKRLSEFRKGKCYNKKLINEENEVKKLILQGKSSREIAKIFKVSQSPILRIRKNMVKMGELNV